MTKKYYNNLSDRQLNRFFTHEQFAGVIEFVKHLDYKYRLALAHSELGLRQSEEDDDDYGGDSDLYRGHQAGIRKCIKILHEEFKLEEKLFNELESDKVSE
jgi:hypothetical protein